MISAGGMKVAYRGIFRRTRRVGRWYFLERDKDPKTLHQVKKNDARIRRAEECRKPRNPLAVPYERYLAYVFIERSLACRDCSCSGSETLASFPRRNNSKQREFVYEEIPEGDAMTRSVEELRRESERNRAQLATTVDRVREQITDTAEDLRHKVSPQHIKSEVSDFISTKTSSWIDSLKQHARENPMQAIAAGTAIAVPILRLARGFPLPLLMIGAGLALSSKTVRERAAEAAAPAADKASEMMVDAMERAPVASG